MGVTVADQIDFTKKFFTECLSIMASKGADYAPTGIAIGEAFWAAAETNTTPELSIYNAMRKHWGAVQTAVRSRQPLVGDTLHNHLVDIANYAVMMDFIIEHRAEYHEAFDQLVKILECTSGDFNNPMPCSHCLMMNWLYPHKLEE